MTAHVDHRKRKPASWGTTATITWRALLLAVLVSVAGVAAILVLAHMDADPAFASAAGMVVAATVGTLGLAVPTGLAGHSAQQYQTRGMPAVMPPPAPTPSPAMLAED